MPDLAVVIVTWNVRDLALDALRSLFADLETSGLSYEVFVVDSASSDGTPQTIAAEFPQVKLTASAENLGFGRANNLALRQIGFGQPQTSSLPAAVYLLNPDTITQLGATRALYDALMAESDVGLVGARLAYGDGSFQHGAFMFPGLRQLWAEFFPTPGRFIEGGFNGRYPRSLYESGQPFSVDFTLGATMMLRREVIQQTGMFDEQFFMYCEEIDWAWRIHKAGWKILCVPSARVVHLAGQSTTQVRPTSIINLWTSRLKLFRKHYPAWKLLLARGMIALGMRRKMRQMQDSALEPADINALLNAYRKIYQLALRP
jgi:GT2 family glycosyltransferase